jgi:peptide/nickel transport system substrate-binding protein
MRHFTSSQYKPLLLANQAKGNYTFFTVKSENNNSNVIMFNLTHKSPTKRAILGSKDFRIGMSHAINRQAIIDAVLGGQGKPYQAAPLEGTPYYNAQLATQYLEYSVALANQALDKVLPDKDGSGIRTLPGGVPFSVKLETSTSDSMGQAIANMCVSYWLAVGVLVVHTPVDRGTLYMHKDANDLDAMIWGGAGGMYPILDPRSYLPWSTEAAWGVAWALWYTGDPSPFKETPTGAVLQTCQLYDQVKAATNNTDKVTLMNQILQIAADNFFCLGLTTPPDSYGIRRHDFHNVTDNMINSWVFPTPAPYNCFTYYMDSHTTNLPIVKK